MGEDLGSAELSLGVGLADFDADLKRAEARLLTSLEAMQAMSDAMATRIEARFSDTGALLDQALQGPLLRLASTGDDVARKVSASLEKVKGQVRDTTDTVEDLHLTLNELSRTSVDAARIGAPDTPSGVAGPAAGAQKTTLADTRNEVWGVRGPVHPGTATNPIVMVLEAAKYTNLGSYAAAVGESNADDDASGSASGADTGDFASAADLGLLTAEVGALASEMHAASQLAREGNRGLAVAKVTQTANRAVAAGVGGERPSATMLAPQAASMGLGDRQALASWELAAANMLDAAKALRDAPASSGKGWNAGDTALAADLVSDAQRAPGQRTVIAATAPQDRAAVSDAVAAVRDAQPGRADILATVAAVREAQAAQPTGASADLLVAADAVRSAEQSDRAALMSGLASVLRGPGALASGAASAQPAQQRRGSAGGVGAAAAAGAGAGRRGGGRHVSVRGPGISFGPLGFPHLRGIGLTGSGRGGGGGGGRGLSNLLRGGGGSGSIAGLAALGSLGSFAGFGPEHVVLSGLGIAGSAASALGGAGLLGLGAAGALGVGAGADAGTFVSTIADTKTLNTAYEQLQTAVADYGKKSTQAAAAQLNLNQQMAALGDTVGVKSELALVKNAEALNTLYDAESGPQRVQATNILEQVVTLGQVYMPLVLAAAERNLTVINNGIKPLFAWLEGPQGIQIWDDLENVFARNLPAGINAFTNSVELILRVMNIAAPLTGGFVTDLDHLSERLNSQSNATLGLEVSKLVGDFRLWESFVVALIRDMHALFDADVNTGGSIIATLTQMLDKLGEWERSTEGHTDLENIFMIHKNEIQELLRILPPLIAAYGKLYSALAPPAVDFVVNVVLPMFTDLAKAADYLASRSSALALVLGGLFVGIKAFGAATVWQGLRSGLGFLTGAEAKNALATNADAAAVGRLAAAEALNAGATGADAAATGRVAAAQAAGAGTAAGASRAAGGGLLAGGLLGLGPRAGSGVVGAAGAAQGAVESGSLSLASVLEGVGLGGLASRVAGAGGAAGEAIATGGLGLGTAAAAALPVALAGGAGLVAGNVGSNLLGVGGVGKGALEGAAAGAAGGAVIAGPLGALVGGAGGAGVGALIALFSQGHTVQIKDFNKALSGTPAQIGALISELKGAQGVKVDGISEPINQVIQALGKAKDTTATWDDGFNAAWEAVHSFAVASGNAIGALNDRFDTNMRLINHTLGVNSALGAALARQNIARMVSDLGTDMDEGRVSVSEGMADLTEVLKHGTEQAGLSWTSQWQDMFTTVDGLWEHHKISVQGYLGDIRSISSTAASAVKADTQAKYQAMFDDLRSQYQDGYLTAQQFHEKTAAAFAGMTSDTRTDLEGFATNMLVGMQQAGVASTAGVQAILDPLNKMLVALGQKPISAVTVSVAATAKQIADAVSGVATGASVSLGAFAPPGQQLGGGAGGGSSSTGTSTSTTSTTTQTTSAGGASGALVQIGAPGAAGRDTVPLRVAGQDIMVGEGEQVAVLNRHQQAYLAARLSDVGGLPGVFSAIQTPNYMAAGGIVASASGAGAVGEAVSAGLGDVAKAASAYLAKIQGASPSAGAGGGAPSGAGEAAPAGEVRDWLTRALRITNHYSLANLSALYGRTMQESGGDPLAINLWDSNAKAGHPSKGLLQTIGSTFASYMLAGYGDIWNPVDNAIAAIRYMFADYGHIVGPSDSGYALGGLIPGFAAGGTAAKKAPGNLPKKQKPFAKRPKLALGPMTTVGKPGAPGAGLPMDMYSIDKVIGQINSLVGPSGDMNSAQELYTYYTSLWNLDPLTYLVSTDPDTGASIAPYVDMGAVQTGFSQLSEVVGWDTGIVADIENADQMVGPLNAAIAKATALRQAAIAALKKKIAEIQAQIKAYLAKIAALKKKIADAQAQQDRLREQGASAAGSSATQNASVSATAAKLNAEIAGLEGQSEPFANPTTKAQRDANSKFSSGRDAQVSSLKAQVDKLDGSKTSSAGAQDKIDLQVDALDVAINGWNQQISGYEQNNVTLGGYATEVGTKGEIATVTNQISPLSSQVSTLQSLGQTWSSEGVTLEGATGLGGDLGSALVQLATDQSSLSPLASYLGEQGGPIAQQLSEAQYSFAQSSSATSSDDALVSLLQQQNTQLAQALQVSQAQYDVLAQLPPYAGSFALGGVVPGPAGVARTVVAHAGEIITPPGAGEQHTHVHITGKDAWLKDLIDVRVQSGTRGIARNAARPLPGRGGGLIRH